MDPSTWLLDGRFEVGDRIGAGGMGAVHCGHDRETAERVAIKLLTSRAEVDAERFRREAGFLAAFQDPAIVRYIAHGVHPVPDSDPAPWIAMEWLEGETMASKIAAGIDAREALRLVREAARAVGVAHSKGLIHRDLKPANLFLVGPQDAPTLKVLDFGIARPMVQGHTLTMTGTAIGTPHTMAPEQARGARDLDARVDVYALGCILYECLSGARPFEADNAIAVLAKILLEEPVPIEDRVEVPVQLAGLLRRVLSKDRDERPGDGGALARELDALGPIEGLTGVRARTQSLGQAEQRLVCVVMAAPSAESAPTRSMHGAPMTERGPAVDPGGADGLAAKLFARAEEFRGHAVALADGTVVCTIAGRGTATDRAERAAALALAWREVLEDAPIVLVAGRAPLGARLPAADVLDRGAERLRGALPARDGRIGVGIDPSIDAFLDERFTRDGPEGERVLFGFVERPLTGRTSLRMPFVGRRRERATLAAIFEECAEEFVARVALVRGEAGAGKTRLIHEVLTELPAHCVFSGHADALRSSSPFATLGDALRRAAGLTGAEPLDVRRATFADRIASVCDEGAVAAFLGEVVEVPFDAEEYPALASARRDPILMGDALRTAAEDFFRAQCARDPVVLVLEDLQWCDRPTLGLVDHLLRRLADARFMVLATARDEVDEVYPALFEARDLIEVPLGQLSAKAATRWIRQAWAEADEESIERIVRHAEGHPFTLEELVRAASAGVREMPLTVLAVIESRLEALDSDARRVLRAASVFGQRSWSGGVQSLVGAGDAAAWLHRLDGDALLMAHDTSRFEGEEEYSFRHALVRDAAYGMLPPEDAALGHRLAGAWLAEGREPDPAIVADHYRQSDAPDLAAAFDAKAARRALDAGDFETALTRADRAKEASSPAVRGAAFLVRCEAYRWMSSYREASAAASSATDLLPPGSAGWFQALGTRIAAAGALREPLDELGIACLQAAPESDAIVDKVICLCRLAHESLGLRRFAEAQRFAAEADALAFFVVDDGPVERNAAEPDRAMAFEATLEAPAGVSTTVPGGSLLGSSADAVDATSTFGGDRQRLQDAAAQAWLHSTHAALALSEVRTSAYLDETRAAIAAYDRAGDARQACNQRVRLGYGLLEIGQWDAAETELRRALDDAHRLGLGMVEGFALQNLGHVVALRGELEGGAELERTAIALGRDLDHPVVEGGARYYLGRIHRWKGDLDRAVDEGRRALDCVAGIPPLRTLCLAEVARAHAARGDSVDALRFAKEAFESRDALGSMPEATLNLYLALSDAGEDVASEALAWLERRYSRLRSEHRDGFDRVPDHVHVRNLST